MGTRDAADGRLNVLFVLSGFKTGGSERVVLDLCRRLDPERFRPHVVGLTGGELEGEFARLGVWTRCLEKGPGIDLSLMRHLAGHARHLGIHLVNAHHFSPFIHAFPAAVLQRAAMLYEDHSVREIRQVPWYWVLAARAGLKSCHGVIGISAGCTRALRETFHLPARKAFTILNAIDLERFDRPIDREAVRRGLGIRDGEQVVGVVANLRAQKNHTDLLRALALLAARGERVRLLVVGDGPLRGALEALRRQLRIEDRVDFLGARLDAPELYRAMDVYCLCSRYEGLPLSILEAMASGVPVVGTDVEGIREVVAHGETGVLVAPGSPDQLAGSLARVLRNSDEARSLAEAGRRYVHKHHAFAPWVRRYEEVFLAAAGRRAPG